MELTVIMKITIFDSRITKMLASFFLAVAMLGGVAAISDANIAEANSAFSKKDFLAKM